MLMNNTDRIIYVHQKTKLYITHTHYMELMQSEGGCMRDITLHEQKPITPLEYPLAPDVLHRIETKTFRYNIISIPYHPDWEVEILPEFTEDELLNLIGHLRFIPNPINEKVEKELCKQVSSFNRRKHEGYTEIMLKY